MLSRSGFQLYSFKMTAKWADWLSDAADTAGPFAKPLTYAYKYRHPIQKHWIKLLIALKKGSPDVIVTGSSGAGKSVLMSNYHGEANELDWQEPGTSVATEIKPITMGQWAQIVYVVPGQEGFERFAAIDTAFHQTKSLDGVIHVVDWGYSAYRDPVIKARMVASGIKTLDQLRSHSLEIELREFEKVCESIKYSASARRGPKWLVIAVNKVDLYIDRLNEAQAYYDLSSSSNFSELIQKLQQHIGANNLKIISIPVCSMPNSFEWNREQVRPQTDSVMEQRGYMRKFIEEIARLQG